MAIGQGVPSYDPFTVASGGLEIVPADWMPASDCRSLVREDPCALWLDWYGDQHGFTPAASGYSFNDFVFRKGKELIISSVIFRLRASRAFPSCWQTRTLWSP